MKVCSTALNMGISVVLYYETVSESLKSFTSNEHYENLVTESEGVLQSRHIMLANTTAKLA